MHTTMGSKTGSILNPSKKFPFVSRLLSGCISFKSYFPTLLYIQRKFEHSTRAGEELPGTIFAIYAPAMFPQEVPCLCPVPQIRVPYKSPQFPMSKKDYKMSRCRLCAFDIYIRIATGICLLTDTGCCNACTSISLAELSASQVWMPSGTNLSFWEQQSFRKYNENTTVTWPLRSHAHFRACMETTKSASTIPFCNEMTPF